MKFRAVHLQSRFFLVSRLLTNSACNMLSDRQRGMYFFLNVPQTTIIAAAQLNFSVWVKLPARSASYQSMNKRPRETQPSGIQEEIQTFTINRLLNNWCCSIFTKQLNDIPACVHISIKMYINVHRHRQYSCLHAESGTLGTLFQLPIEVKNKR